MKAAAFAIAVAALAACTRGKGNDGAPATGGSPGSAIAGSGSAAAGSGAAGTPGVVTITDVASARAAVGKRVRNDGTGDNAKLGAVVVTGELVVYCADRKFGWDERNLPVVVEGVLSVRDTTARTGSSGEVSAGTGEPTFELDTCTVVGGAGATP